jgi:DNA-binding SARP family transcriptional activator
MVRLSLTLLGGFRARLDSDQALVIAIKKSQALLAYLAWSLTSEASSFAPWTESRR